MSSLADRFSALFLTFCNSLFNKNRTTDPARRHHVERYKVRIQSYCEEAGIEVPVGFGRHAAGRYVAIDLESSPPKLVATTWPNRRDAVNYLVNLAVGRRTRILDFKDRRELSFDGKASLLRGAVF